MKEGKVERATPRPWRAAAKASSIVGWPIVGPGGRIIANIHGNEKDAESIANKNLIIAAPVMRDALQIADEAINPPDKDGISLHEWNVRLKAATALIRAALSVAQKTGGEDG